MRKDFSRFRPIRYLAFAAFLGFCCLASTLAHADEVAVSATGVFPGIVSASCGASCTQLFSAFFDFDTAAQAIVPGTLEFASSGPLEPLSLVASGGFFFNWANVAGDLMQLDFDNDFESFQVFPATGVYPVGDLAIICHTAACLQDFGESFDSGGQPFSGNIVNIEVIAVPTSEASEILLLTFGLLGLSVLMLRKQRLSEKLSAVKI